MPLAWLDGVTITVEAALSAATGTYGAWDNGLWGTATWGPDVVWVDISARFRSVETDRRFSRELQAWEAGTAQLELWNLDGLLSPLNLLPSSPYVVAGVTGIRPWRPLRIRIDYVGVTYPLYVGDVTDWKESWVSAGPDAGMAVVIVPCVDEYGTLAAFDGVELAEQGAGETSGRRVHRILDAAGHTGERAIDEGLITMQATTLAQNALTELQLTVDSEGGSAYVDRAGVLVFEDQYALLESTRSNTVQATFGDGKELGADELDCVDTAAEYGGSLLRNIVSFARKDGTAQSVTDESSRALYRDRRYTRTDLICETDDQALALAEWYLHRFSQPEQRFTEVVINPRTNPVLLYPAVLGREVRDLIRVVRRPPGGLTMSRDCHIAGISHRITPDTWTTTFALSSATPYTGFIDSRWDVGVWDSSRFFF